MGVTSLDTMMGLFGLGIHQGSHHEWTFIRDELGTTKQKSWWGTKTKLTHQNSGHGGKEGNIGTARRGKSHEGEWHDNDDTHNNNKNNNGQPSIPSHHNDPKCHHKWNYNHCEHIDSTNAPNKYSHANARSSWPCHHPQPNICSQMELLSLGAPHKHQGMKQQQWCQQMVKLTFILPHPKICLPMVVPSIPLEPHKFQHSKQQWQCQSNAKLTFLPCWPKMLSPMQLSLRIPWWHQCTK